MLKDSASLGFLISISELGRQKNGSIENVKGHVVGMLRALEKWGPVMAEVPLFGVQLCGSQP